MVQRDTSLFYLSPIFKRKSRKSSEISLRLNKYTYTVVHTVQIHNHQPCHGIVTTTATTTKIVLTTPMKTMVAIPTVRATVTRILRIDHVVPIIEAVAAAVEIEAEEEETDVIMTTIIDHPIIQCAIVDHRIVPAV